MNEFTFRGKYRRMKIKSKIKYKREKKENVIEIEMEEDFLFYSKDVFTDICEVKK